MIAIAAIAFFLSETGAHAGGYGLYNSVEITIAELDGAIPFNAGKVNRNFEQNPWSIGFVYDSNVARDEPWNYRARVGYRRGKRKYDKHDTIRISRRADTEDPDEKILTFEPKDKNVDGFTFNQAVGYGLLRDESFRIWAGPSLRLNVDWQGIVTDLDTIDVSVGGGPEIGINYHVSDRISLAGSVAYQFMYLNQSFETLGDDESIDGYQHLVGVTLTVFWRTEDDRFDSKSR